MEKISIEDKDYPLLKIFFDQSYEQYITANTFYGNRKKEPKENVINYINEVLSIPYRKFIAYSTSMIHHTILDVEIPQHSNLETGSILLCKRFKENEFPVCNTTIEIGKIIDPQEKDDGAHSKYGETGIKLAQMYGLSFLRNDYKWELTYIGKIFPELSEDQCKAFRNRAILRNNLFSTLITDALKRDVIIYDYLSALPGHSTRIRRSSNVYNVLKEIIEECKKSNISLHTFIKSPGEEPSEIEDNSEENSDFTLAFTQKIYYGAPGTGKSQGLKCKRNTTRITFHPDTDYASFVGCYKPKTIDGNIKYMFSPQAFFDIYVAAWNNPTKEHHLLIEEINRGNCAQIFGDLFQLLDRDSNGFSDYPIKADTDMWNEMSSKLPSNYVEFLTEYYQKSQGEGFSGEGKIALPPNLSIIATMNTSDNSLYKMDSAFKRRWEWEYVKIDYKQPELQNVILDFLDAPNNKWLPILERLNKFIKDSTGSTAKQIGQWFVKPLKDGADNYTTITFNTLVNKVMFFLFNDVYKDRDELKSLFGKDDEEFLFEDLVTLPQDDATKLLKTFIDNLPRIE